MSTLSKGAVYTAARYQRAIASSGGVSPQQILQAPANGIVLVSGMMHHTQLNNNGYSFFISSSNGGSGFNTAGATVFWPGSAGIINVGVGNGAGITTNWAHPASFNNGVLISGSAAGYMYFKDLVVPSSHYLMWYLSGGAGANNVGYDLNTVIISQS